MRSISARLLLYQAKNLLLDASGLNNYRLIKNIQIYKEIEQNDRYKKRSAIATKTNQGP
jgi:hypothetical protein